MRLRHRAHEWAADRLSWVQYPRGAVAMALRSTGATEQSAHPVLKAFVVLLAIFWGIVLSGFLAGAGLVAWVFIKATLTA
ncbi:MAG: hypothetical protein EKK46_15170 [Rhodocyclaceae bacterium]|nr:MAG: hypothetical protein EKK46_15170 [Rhodocyclaceae bacterium]